MADCPAPDGADVTEPSSNPVHPSTIASWLAPALAGLAYLVYWQVVPRLRTESMGAVTLSTLFSLGLIVWYTASLARTVKSLRVLVICGFVCGMIVIPLKIMLSKGNVLGPWIILMRIPGLADLLFIWLAASFGAALSLLLRSANMIPPVAAVLALVDTWTVLLGGPVQRIMESTNPVAQAFSQAMTVPIPTPRVGASPFKPTSFVGFADFVFIAFFVAALCRLIDYEGAYRRTVRALVVVLCLYMLAVITEPNLRALPALVPMAAVMIGLHWRHFRYERSEAFALLYAAIVVAGIAAGFWYFGRNNRSEEPRPRAGIPYRMSGYS
jgi:hypothetical protein